MSVGTWLLPVAAIVLPADCQPLEVHVGGRTLVAQDGSTSFGWPGVYFEGRFRGTGVRVRFDAPTDHLRLLIDGEEKAVFRGAGAVDMTFTGLGEGEHVARLEKLTESQMGGSRFFGFYTAAGGTPLPPRPRARQIEFIGDSFTVGYGNTAPGTACTPREVHDLTDTSQSFGSLAARRLDADYRITAYSGFGMIRNYDGGNPGLSLPAIYDRPKPDTAAGRSQHSAWRPQWIVINLGTNDFSTPLQAGERWPDTDALRADYRRRYVAFVSKLHARYPQARFILMGSDAFFAEVEKVARQLRTKLPGRITTLRFAGLDLQGCHGHPSLADHRLLAALVAEAVGKREPWLLPALGEGGVATNGDVPEAYRCGQSCSEHRGGTAWQSHAVGRCLAARRPR